MNNNFTTSISFSVQQTCGGISAYNNTYFVNPDFPRTVLGGTSCILTIRRCNPDICQVN